MVYFICEMLKAMITVAKCIYCKLQFFAKCIKGNSKVKGQSKCVVILTAMKWSKINWNFCAILNNVKSRRDSTYDRAVASYPAYPGSNTDNSSCCSVPCLAANNEKELESDLNSSTDTLVRL